MRFVPSDKYTIAWFKIAECVARGERERALGVYRLLIHSFDDPALAQQLEGDIILAFDEPLKAFERYKEAAVLYQKSGRLLEAAAVTEHLITLSAQKQEYLAQAANLYAALNMPRKAIAHLHALIALALGKNDTAQAVQALEQLASLAAPAELVLARQQVIHAMITDKFPLESMIAQINGLIDGLLECNNQLLLQQFMAYLEGQSHELHAHATHYLAQKP